MARTSDDTTDGTFSERERAAMKERAAELRKEAGRGRGGRAAADEAALLDKIEQMPEPDRTTAQRIHALVTANAPELAPKLWYGQPAWARKGKVLCFFRSGQADGERYSTFGVTPEAALDEASGTWPTSFAVTELTDQAEQTLAALLQRALA
ncbi:DUF1801 domain-containing protein [Auraticoccus monumenti]|uniref:YdhG-like domain-containing protein n=1 Tax=Auraticoccus monumenti TaxID=675864 RepID=A0A1G6VBT0_9ACTN|nr:DUF1801 domain-containing protein [Auraticoccus monumenti]SDD50951.1 hypothetical protein SAMN04489747_1107 [Auraticoccus monumenti]